MLEQKKVIHMLNSRNARNRRSARFVIELAQGTILNLIAMTAASVRDLAPSLRISCPT